MGAPTATSSPARLRILPSTPASSAVKSTSALSVSMVARMSPTAMASPSCLSHSLSTAEVPLAAISGMRMSFAMSARSVDQVGTVVADVFVLHQFEDVALGVAAERQVNAGPHFHTLRAGHELDSGAL
ncbi:hypothetical protein D3C78_309830 [compost metagenome]